jgi:hypothetical protein
MGSKLLGSCTQVMSESASLDNTNNSKIKKKEHQPGCEQRKSLLVEHLHPAKVTSPKTNSYPSLTAKKVTVKASQ